LELEERPKKKKKTPKKKTKKKKKKKKNTQLRKRVKWSEESLNQSKANQQ